MNRSYRNFAIGIFAIGVLLALSASSLTHLFAVSSWDRVFPSSSPQLTNSELITVRDAVARELSRLFVIVGIFLAVIGAFNLWRSYRSN